MERATDADPAVLELPSQLREALEYIVTRHTWKVIAEQMDITLTTFQSYINRLYKITKTRRRDQLIDWALARKIEGRTFVQAVDVALKGRQSDVHLLGDDLP